MRSGIRDQGSGIRLSDEELQTLCRQWQAVLRLEHIDVHVRYAQKLEMEEWGHTQRGPDSTWANIVICPPDLVNFDTHTRTDPELTLIHELLHVREEWDCEPKWQELKDKKLNPTVFKMHERGIERTAQALLLLKRLIPEPCSLFPASGASQ